MCGICGVALSERSAQHVDASLLERMRRVLVHRGPDDHGIFLDERVGLGHQRLSIVDIDGGRQPMLSHDGALCIVYNGEVYNHPTLRVELERQGYRYRTRCDTETVLRLCELYREEAPQHLRGMFAFAVWDSCRRELLLGRDRFGVKPLYYVHAADGSLYFASEIKSLLAANAVAPRLNLAALPDFLANHAPSDEETLFEDVRRLPPGCTLRWRDGEVRVDRYWDLAGDSRALASRSDADLIAEFGDRFKESVRLRLMADVPLGVFLSGGIDSAAIAAVMSDLVDDRISTFSVAFAEREANELAYARIVADRLHTHHREVVVSPREFFDALPHMVWHEDEPLAHPSSVALYFVARLAAEHVKVVLTGEGSDEMLAGYGRYRTTVYNLRLGRRYESMAPQALRATVRAGIGQLARRSRLGRRLARTALALPADLVSLYFDNFAVFSLERQRALLRPELLDRLGDINPYAAHCRHFEKHGERSLLRGLLYADSRTYLQELLMKQDQMSMAASIESRVPFLDHPFAEFADALPAHLKLRGWTTKYALRQAMRGVLPDVILSRRKMGFPVPIGRWLRNQFRPLLDEYVLSERAAGRELFDRAALRGLVARHERGEDHASRLWALINLEMWHRIFIDGEEPAPAASLEPSRNRRVAVATA